MKTILTLVIFGALALPAFAGSTRTTTTSTYEETSTAPVMNSDMNMDSGASSDMIEAEEYDDSLSTDEVDQARWDEQQRMEERNQNSSNIIESEEAIDYSDRTRTDRARKALNTGSDASDDE